MSKELYSERDLEQFKAVQRLAYDTCQAVERRLRPGDTERDAARMMREAFADAGVTEFFHAPFAWFGERTAFTGFSTVFDFLPTKKRLEKGMPVILDAGPIRDGYTSDIGYAFCHGGENEVLNRARFDLDIIRGMILEEVLAERTMQQIYETLDQFLEERGYVNCHYQYPFHVLGHKVGRMRASGAPPELFGGFDLNTLLFLGRGMLKARLLGTGRRTPLWNGNQQAAVAAEPGLWAVEPHVGRDGVGAKWEELLVVTESTAYWLDDALPHREWVRARKAVQGDVSVG